MSRAKALLEKDSVNPLVRISRNDPARKKAERLMGLLKNNSGRLAALSDTLKIQIDTKDFHKLKSTIKSIQSISSDLMKELK